MPLWLRKLTFNKLKEYYDQKASQNEKWLVNEDNPNSVSSKEEILKNINAKPDYSVKTPKK